VAGEVRSLAQRSAAAAKEIAGLIHASTEKVDSGSKLVQSAGTSMDDIVTQVRELAHLIKEISTSSNEQSNGIGEVNIAVGQLDQMTQQNAALVEESAAAADSLEGLATRLAEAVLVFKPSGNMLMASAPQSFGTRTASPARKLSQAHGPRRLAAPLHRQR
jgi:methyl-accepting chemotaxis protein